MCLLCWYAAAVGREASSERVVVEAGLARPDLDTGVWGGREDENEPLLAAVAQPGYDVDHTAHA